MVIRKKVLITGVSGILGSNLAFFLKDSYEILGLYCQHPFECDGVKTQKIDLLKDDIRKRVEAFKPEVIIHCAALADVDRCEREKDLAYELNVEATKRLVAGLKDDSCKLIYISTDLVYDGIKGQYQETDSIKPINVYGETKYEGELAIQEKAGSLILRTNFFGMTPYERLSLGEWVIRELSKGKGIKGFTDVFFSSIYTRCFADVIKKMIEGDLNGIYHLASRDSCSKDQFARKIAALLDLDQSLIQPISVDEFKFDAKRSKDLSLKTEKLAQDLGETLPSIDESIDSFLKDRKAGLSQAIKAGYQDSSITKESVI